MSSREITAQALRMLTRGFRHARSVNERVCDLRTRSALSRHARISWAGRWSASPAGRRDYVGRGENRSVREACAAPMEGDACQLSGLKFDD